MAKKIKSGPHGGKKNKNRTTLWQKQIKKDQTVAKPSKQKVFAHLSGVVEVISVDGRFLV